VRDRHLRITALALLTGLAVASRASSQTPRTATLPVITTIKAIRALSQDEGARGYPVRVRAIVTHVDERSAATVIIHDGEFGQFVMPPANLATAGAWRDLQRGDLVEIEGRTIRGGFAPNVQPTMVRRLGQAPLPRPKEIPFSSMLTGRHDCDYVELEGVVQRAWFSSDPQMHTLFADVAFEEGIVRANFWDYSPDDLPRLIDARVRLRGNVGTLFGRTEQLRGVSLFVGRTSDIVVLESPPDPFSQPTRSIRSIYNYSPAGEVNRRIRVRGVVTCYIPGHPVEVSDFTTMTTFRYIRHVLYVDDGTGGARIETEQPLRVRPGTVVEVAGFPAVTPGKPILTNAIFRVTGQASQPAATTVAATNVLTPENDAALVRLEGHFLSLLTGPTERILVLKVGETLFDAHLAADPSTDALEQIAPGSVLAVTGVYSYQWGVPPSFRLFLRSASDVSVVSVAPWWTLRHTLVMAAMLVFVGCAAAFWVRTTANRKRQQYQAVLNERSRVGRELHDTLEQGLAGIALQLEAVAGSLQTSPQVAQQSLDVARQMLRYSQEETRRSVMDLRSQALESRDLAGALLDLALQMTGGTNVHADVHIEGTPRRLDASHEHHLLRIGLEALTNALKHSGARRIEMTLRFRPDATDLIVADDGQGFPSDRASAAGGPGLALANQISGEHFGLLGIRERVDKIGGILHINSEAGAGTRLSVTLPARRLESSDAVAAVLGESWRTS
jgi:signal transduction histidine kinase